MSNIRFKRFEVPEEGSWMMDCILLPSDAIDGELVHYDTKKLIDFHDVVEPGLFCDLNGLLDSMSPTIQNTEGEVRLVVGRLKNGKKEYFRILAAERYCSDAPESAIWDRVNEVFRKRMKSVNSEGLDR